MLGLRTPATTSATPIHALLTMVSRSSIWRSTSPLDQLAGTEAQAAEATLEQGDGQFQLLSHTSVKANSSVTGFPGKEKAVPEFGLRVSGQ